MAETIFYRKYRKFSHKEKNNHIKILNNLRVIDFTKIKLFCFRNRNEDNKIKTDGC